MNHLTITGAPVGGIQPRLEINNFVANEKHFSLFVQAWQMMQVDTQDDLGSFFQVGGIHGLPFVSWNEAGTQQQSLSWGGYCTHSSVIFPTWHRPYVALVEQIISDFAQQIASRYTVNGTAWQQAAQELRFPYWDWAQNAVPPDQVISLDQVNITAPNGTRIAASNPLRRYTFHPIGSSFPFLYSQWPTTLRQPNTTNANATDDVARLRSILQSAQKGITTSTFSMLTTINAWNSFSNCGANGSSLECIHNNIHVHVGGNGHMGDPRVAGFDPIFFMHHCNVDRMLSLWSAINPGVWVSPGNVPRGTFTLQSGASVDTNTHVFWTSAAITNSTALGYTYPEFVGLNGISPGTLRLIILGIVNRLYGATSRHALTALGGATTGNFTEWFASVEFNTQEIGNSFSVLFFLGDVPEDPSEWLLSPNNVGAASAFTSNTTGGPQSDVQQGLVLLNEGIAELSGLGSFDASEVEPYLAANLHSRVLKVDGTAVELGSLAVTVLEVPVNLAEEDGIPVPGKPIKHGFIEGGPE